MKKLLLLFFGFLSFYTNSQEKVINTQVNAATVFLNSAQVTRTKTIELVKGENVLKFVNLSPFIDTKSIQIKALDIEIEAIDFKKDYLKSKKKNPKITALVTKLKALNEKIAAKNVDLDILKDEINFLNVNKSIGAENQTLSVNALKEAASFYGSKMKALKTKQFSINKEVSELNSELAKINQQIKEIKPLKNYGLGEITVKLNSKTTKTLTLELRYMVGNVGWKPSYDVRVKDISSPLQLVYKANLQQNSQVDWKNVKLRFSSANPSKSAKVKKVIPYFIDYGTYPPNYKSSGGKINGTVTDYNGGLSGVSVLVKGTTIGTDTDFEGNFSLELPAGRQTLVFSYLGYKTVERVVYGSTVNVRMEEDGMALDEVVVTAYGGRSGKRRKVSKAINKTLEGKVAGALVKEEKKSFIDNALKTRDIINQTEVSFEVLKPYSIQSSNKYVSVPVKSYTSKASYRYFAFPKIDVNAYLVAKLSNWERFNLLEGEANIYFEDTFMGTSLLDIRAAKKELELSLGIDKNVQIERKKEQGYTTKQLIGNRQEESRIWNFTVKNNKPMPISMVISDQIPISSREQIKVELDTKTTQGKLNKQTGEIQWMFLIPSKQVESFKLKYAVKYPKNTRIQID